MELYDKANELAKAIQNCKEYVELVEAGKGLAEDEKKAHLGQGFLIMQAQLAYSETMGKKPIRQKIEKLNRKAETL